MRLHFLRNIPSISQVRSRLISRRGAAVLLVSVLVISAWLVRPASAAIAFRAAGIGNNGTGANTVTVSKPTGTVEKDVMVAVVSINQAGSTMLAGAPNGWTLINENVSGTTVYSGTFYKVATASEPASYDFTLLVGMVPTSKKAAGVIVSYSGVDTINPIDAQGSLVNASSATMTAPSVTTTAANAMLVAAYGTATGTTIATGGSSMNLRGQATSAGGGGAGTKATSAVQDVIQATAGATGSKTMTAGAAAVNIGHLIALKPEPIFSVSSYRFFTNATTSSSVGFAKLSNPSALPTATGNHTAWSADGTYMTVAHATTPFITIYKRSGDTFTKLANPATLPTGTGNGVAWSADGTYMTVAHATTPFITIYKRSGDTFTKLANPATLPTGTANGVAWSADGTYMTVAHATSPFATTYKRSGDTFTKLSDPATLPTGAGNGVAWSADGTYVTIAHATTPFITIYKRATDTFTKLSDPATLPGSMTNSPSWSPDGTYLSLAVSSTSPYMAIYKRSGDTFTKLSDPASVPTSSGFETAWSPDGTHLAVGYGASPYLAIYKRSGDTFTRQPNPASLPPAAVNGIAWSSDGAYISMAHASSPFVTTYSVKPEAEVSAPVANQDAAAVSGGAGNPFRLRMNIHTTESSALRGTSLKLQYASRSGTCDTSYSGEVYSDVGTASGPVRYYDNVNLNDADAVSSDANNPTHSADTILRQSYEESNTFNVAERIGIGQDGTWDFSLVFDSSAAYGSYCFRVVQSDGAAIATPTQVPEVINPAPTVGQANYRLFANADSTTPGAPLAAQDTAATIAAETPFRLRQRLAVGTAGLSQSGQNYKLQYAEKNGVCDVGFSGETYNDVVSVGSTAMKLTGTGGIGGSGSPWNFASNITSDSDGDLAAEASITTTNASADLRATNFNFAIPANATVTGVEAVVTKSASAMLVYDNTVRLVDNGTLIGTSQSLASAWPGSISDTSYGGSANLWGSTLTPSVVNSSTFGMSIKVSPSLDNSGTARVYHVKMKVYYTTPSEIQYNLNPTPADLATISSNPNDPTNASRPTVYQSYRETDPFTNNVAAIPPGSDGLWDFALMGGSAVAGKTYCMRVVKSDGSLLDSYSQIPEITFSSGGGGGLTLDQQLRGGAGVVNGTKSPLVW